MSDLSRSVGPQAVFYQTIGVIASCILYNLFLCYQNYRMPNGKCSIDYGFIKRGKFKKKNFIGFLAITFTLMLNQLALNNSIWLARLADMNVGLVSVIWQAAPIFTAFSSRIFFKETIKWHNWLGMLLILGCSVTLGLSRTIQESQKMRQSIGTGS